ncbi:MAG TPA: ATP-binding protein [Chloroflexota bacterium]
MSRLSAEEAIQYVVDLLSVTGDANEVVSMIARAAKQMMDADEAYLLLREGGHLVLRAADGLPDELIGRKVLRAGEGIEGWVADQGEAVALSDAARERRFRDIPGRSRRIRALAAVPMKLRDDVVGVLATAGIAPFPLGMSRLTGLGILAGIAAVTLENDRLLAQEHRRVEQAELLLELAAAEQPELLSFLQRVASATNGALGADDTVIALRDERGREVICTAGSSPAAEESRRRDGAARGLLDTAWAREILATGQPFLCGDTSEEPSVSRDPVVMGRRSFVAVPIQMRGERRGILMMAAAEPNGFGPEDTAFLTLIATQAGLSAERTELARRQLEVSREQAKQQARQEFLGQVSHELKTPVAVLKAYTELLTRKAELDPSRASDQDILARMLEQTDWMLAMIEQLLDLQKLETGQLTLEVSRFDLMELARRVAENLQMAAPEHILRTAGASTPVLADKRRVEEVLFNLAENGVKYSQAGTEVQITVREQSGSGGGREALVEVADQGVGIPEHDLQRIFERFYQGRGGFRRGHVGLGLGLYIAREIVELHGGRIWAESTPRMGARLYFTLPLVQGD